MPEAWQQRIETIASNLLTLEVNTAIKEDGISAQKMPEPPLALHSLVDSYGNYLKECGCPITQNLIVLAARRLISDDVAAAAIRQTLASWDPRADQTEPVVTLTNGAETFEAFLWAAVACSNGRRRDDATCEPDKGLLTRIGANGRQLREAAIVLEQEFSSERSDLQDSATSYRARLKALADGQPADPRSRLFGGTIDQTVQVLFRHPRPVLSVAPDLTVLIRKAWDIGLEEIRFQTTLQLDGDVLVRVAREADATQRNYLAELHRQAVQDGLTQWRLMFKVIRDLISDVGRLIFGRGA